MTKSKLQKQLENFNLLDAPGHLLRRNHQRSYEIFNRFVGDDVTRQQMALLVELAKRPGASQQELVEATGIDKSTLKEMIGRMVAKGWMKRERDAKDGRAWTMWITGDGEELISTRLDAINRAQAAILAPLNPDERAVFIRSLKILVGLDPSSDKKGD